MSQAQDDLVAAASNPNAELATLHELANNYPGLRPYIAANPRTYPALLEWLGTLGDPAVDAALEEFGRLDIVINNAGTGSFGPAEDLTDEQFDTEVDIDLYGIFRVSRAAAKKAMIPAGYGRIINVASMYGMVGSNVAGMAAYHAAKGGAVNMTRALGAEWAKYGITVNALCPGYFYSELTTDVLDDEDTGSAFRSMIPLDRFGKEGELDTAILFLASKASGYVVGAPILVDGGYSAI